MSYREWMCLNCGHVQQSEGNPDPCPECGRYAFADRPTRDVDLLDTILLPESPEQTTT